MNGGGYIKLFRQLVDWRWYRDTNTFRVFMHLLLIANYDDRVCLGVDIPRGSAVFTLPELSSALDLSIQQTRTALSHLKSTGEITVRTYRKFSVVDIQNYDKFQGGNRQSNSQPAEKSTDKPQEEQQTAIHYKRNKKKEIINNNIKKKEGRAQGQALSEGGSGALHLNLEEAQRKAACGELKVRKRG